MPSARRFAAVTIIGFLAVEFGICAGNDPEEESAIRKAIAAVGPDLSAAGNATQDFVFWSGAYKRPVISGTDAEKYERPGSGRPSNRVAGSQKAIVVPVRIVVSDSKDLAYEYNTFTLEFDTKDGKHTKVEGAGLRVWQKQNGEWKQAAFFTRPYDE